MSRPTMRFDRASLLAFAPKSVPVVYRLYKERDQWLDHEDKRYLIYVGATISPRRRLLEHLRNPDLSGAETVELEYFRTSTAMARAEAEAQRDERPVKRAPARRHHVWKAQPKRSKAR